MYQCSLCKEPIGFLTLTFRVRTREVELHYDCAQEWIRSYQQQKKERRLRQKQAKQLATVNV